MKERAGAPPLVELLLRKYRADPEGFRSYLPEVARELDANYPPRRPSRSPFGLTEHERLHRVQVLRQVLEQLSTGKVTREEAVRGLDHCAVLINDDSLPDDVGHATLVQLLKAGTGKSPGSIRAVTTIPLRGGQETPAVVRVSLVRGVTLNLTADMQLVSATITPTKVEQRKKLLQFVGAAQDQPRDVAEKHDLYLAETSPHAAP